MQIPLAQTLDIPTVTNVAVIAAVVGFVGSMTVAVINAIAARRLERSKSLREYRSKLSEPCRDYATSASALVGSYRTRLSMWNYEQLGTQPAEWVETLRNRAIEIGAVATPNPMVSRALKNCARAQRLLADEIKFQGQRPQQDATANCGYLLDVLMRSYASVESALEVFVFGGVQARIQISRRLRRIENAISRVAVEQSERTHGAHNGN